MIAPILDAYPKRDCPACGSSFVVVNPRAVYCTKQCKWKTNKRTARYPEKSRATIIAEFGGACAECKQTPHDFLPPWDGFFIREGWPLCGKCNSGVSIAMFRVRLPDVKKGHRKRVYQARRIAAEAAEIAKATAPRADPVTSSVGQPGG